MASDARRAGVDVQTQPRGLFTDLLPPAAAHAARAVQQAREGLVPDALVRGVFDASTRPFLVDVKCIRFCASRYRIADAAATRPAAAADRRAASVATDYAAAARALDASYHAHIADPAQRPLTQRLASYPDPRGWVWGAFAEASANVHRFCEATADAAAERFWREVGGASQVAARARYLGLYRQRWGCAAALSGARLRISRVTYVTDAAPAEARTGGASTFDPASHEHVLSATAPRVGGSPAGQGPRAWP